MTPATTDSLVDALRRLGVSSGGVVMIHASLRKIGPVDGGVAGVIRALDEAVGPDGTLLMVLGARNDWDWVNTHPESQRAALLTDAEPIDCLLTPAESDVGYLAEAFRSTPGTSVSDHPEGRFAARGRLAEHFTTNVPWDDYYGPGSPLERLVEAGGHVLRLGADTNTVTLLHHAEYLADVPGKRRVRRHRLVRTPDGPVVRVVECLDDSEGIVEWNDEDYFSLVLKEYLASHQVPRGRVGGAESELLPAGELVAFGAAWMTANLSVG